MAFQEGNGGGGRGLLAEQEPELGRCAGLQSELRLHRAAGIQAAADPIRQLMCFEQA